ncbi:lysophospholipid acyltransferase [Apophysomyces sp. BC1034]|nr:lysophospholipid acyltransferase [Apophysomyces sp. BC1034]
MVTVLKAYTGFLHIIITCTCTFLLMKYYRGSNGPWINFVLAMASMSICHLDRQWKGYYGDTTLDYSGALMVLTIKLSSFGWSVHDGRMQDQTGLTEYNQRMKITRFPSAVEFFGWALFFGGFLTGPACEFMDYMRFTNPRPEDVSKESVWMPAARSVLKGLFFCSILIKWAPSINYFAALEPAWDKLPFFKRLLFLQVSGLMTRSKYYVVWSLAEGACILSGFGFNGYDQQGCPRWDRLVNVRIVDVETAQSYKLLGEAWNIGANIWLRHYVYLRMTPAGTKPRPSSAIVTYAVSSMWHGFHPGYYFMFISVSFLQILARKVRSCVRPLMFTPDGKEPLPFWNTAYNTVGWIMTMGIMNILIAPFDVLYVARTMHIWRGVYLFHFWFYLAALTLWYVSHPLLFAWQKRRMEKAGVTREATSKDARNEKMD